LVDNTRKHTSSATQSKLAWVTSPRLVGVEIDSGSVKSRMYSQVARAILILPVAKNNGVLVGGSPDRQIHTHCRRYNLRGRPTSDICLVVCRPKGPYLPLYLANPPDDRISTKRSTVAEAVNLLVDERTSFSGVLLSSLTTALRCAFLLNGNNGLRGFRFGKSGCS
jgi:hypothetical protein